MSRASRNSAMEQSHPYKGFYKIVPVVMQRDNYVCQWCGKTVGDFITRHASAIGDY